LILFGFGLFHLLSQDRQACWEWIGNLIGQLEVMWGIPAGRSVIESEAFRQKVGVERAAVCEASIAAADHPPSYQFYPDQCIPNRFLTICIHKSYLS
jgi:hypothetical protein